MPHRRCEIFVTQTEVRLRDPKSKETLKKFSGSEALMKAKLHANHMNNSREGDRVSSVLYSHFSNIGRTDLISRLMAYHSKTPIMAEIKYAIGVSP